MNLTTLAHVLMYTVIGGCRRLDANQGRPPRPDLPRKAGLPAQSWLVVLLFLLVRLGSCPAPKPAECLGPAHLSRPGTYGWHCTESWAGSESRCENSKQQNYSSVRTWMKALTSVCTCPIVMAAALGLLASLLSLAHQRSPPCCSSTHMFDHSWHKASQQTVCMHTMLTA